MAIVSMAIVHTGSFPHGSFPHGNCPPGNCPRTREICGYKRTQRRGKKSEWWDDEKRELVKVKRRLYEIYLRTKCEHDRNEYYRKNTEV